MGGTAIRITPFLTVITLTALILKETEVAMAAVGAILSIAKPAKRPPKRKTTPTNRQPPTDPAG